MSRRLRATNHLLCGDPARLLVAGSPGHRGKTQAEASSKAMFGIQTNDYAGGKREGIVRRCDPFIGSARSRLSGTSPESSSPSRRRAV